MPNEKKRRKLHDVNEISKTSSEENNFVENEENEANNLENSEEIALVAPRPLSPYEVTHPIPEATTRGKKRRCE